MTSLRAIIHIVVEEEGYNDTFVVNLDTTIEVSTYTIYEVHVGITVDITFPCH